MEMDVLDWGYGYPLYPDEEAADVWDGKVYD